MTDDIELSENWEVPFMPELTVITEDAVDDQENDKTQNAEANTSPSIHLSLQEFMPPSGSSFNPSSTDYYNRHDSFRSMSSSCDPTVARSVTTFGAATSGAIGDVSSAAEVEDNFASPIAEVADTTQTSERLERPPDAAPDSPPGEEPIPPRDEQAPVITFRVTRSSPVPRTPPRVRRLDFSFLEPPSPIPIRSSIAHQQVLGRTSVTYTDVAQFGGGTGSDSNQNTVAAAVKAPLDRQGLEDFLSVLGHRELYSELEMLEYQLEEPLPPLAQQIQKSQPWLVDLDYLTKSIDDEVVFTQTVGNLSYLSACEVSEKRCRRYSDKLTSLLSRYSFDRLSYQVDLWSLNSEDREAIAERISRFVRVRLKIANNCSDRQWVHDLHGEQFSRDIVKMTLVYTKQYRADLLKFKEVYTELLTDMGECETAVKADVASRQTKVEIVNRWKDTVSYFAQKLQGLQRREQWLTQKTTEWKEEADRLKECVRKHNAHLTRENRRAERIRDLIFSLNAYRERCLLVDEWSLVKLRVDAPTSVVHLYLQAAVDLCSNFVNPATLVDATLWLHDKAVEKNLETRENRQRILQARFKYVRLLDTIILAINPWHLELKLKSNRQPVISCLRLGKDEVCWDSVVKRLREEVNIASSATPVDAEGSNLAPKENKAEAQLALNLFCNILKILAGAVHDMLVTTFQDLRQAASIDDLGGIAWCLAGNATRLAVEIVALWHEFGAYNEDVLCLSFPDAQESHTSMFHIYCYKSGEGSPKLLTKIPVAIKNYIDSVSLRFDLFAAIHAGGLHAGFEHADNLNADELHNVRAELRRKSRETCSGCALSAVTHSSAMGDVFQRLIPFMIKRSSND